MEGASVYLRTVGGSSSLGNTQGDCEMNPVLLTFATITKALRLFNWDFAVASMMVESLRIGHALVIYQNPDEDSDVEFASFYNLIDPILEPRLKECRNSMNDAVTYRIIIPLPEGVNSLQQIPQIR
jgi:hypothetical protein